MGLSSVQKFGASGSASSSSNSASIATISTIASTSTNSHITNSAGGSMSCHCKSDDLFVAPPAQRKMKLFKKIKLRMGLVTRPSVPCPSPNNLPPLTFHQVHGDHVRISHERRIAKRVESFCKGIAFSARPVRVNERVCVKFSEISNNWSGVIRFGFTTVDPATLRHNLPKYACPDLANKAGFWIKALNETYCERGNILYYYVTASGNVHFGINGEEKDVFMTGIETRTPLWTIIDIYGNCTAIEFLDYRTNSRSSEMNSALSSGSLCRQPSYPPQGQCQQQMINAGPHRPIMMRNPINGSLDTDVDRIVPAFQSMSVQNAQNSTESNLHFPPVRYLPYGSLTQLVPMPFHRTKGRNVYISQNRCIASRNDNEFCQGYVFTGRPLRIGETLIIQILRTDSIYLGALAIGLTSCDPSTLSPLDLPDDSELLLDRPEYWVVSKDAASAPNTGDEIAFCVTRTGEVTIRKNGGPPTTVMHVDQSLELYAFLDVYGSTQSVRVMSQAPLAHSSQYLPASQLSLNSATSSVGLNTSGSTNLSGQGGVRMPQSPQRLQVQMPGADSMTSLASQMEVRSNNYMPPPCQMSQNNVNNRVANANNNANLVQLQSRGAVLVVNLPPDVLTTASQQMASPRVTTMTANAATISVPASANLIEPFTMSSANQPAPASSECTICYENSIDSVLYMCGHMCMCYECAVQQWRGIGGGHCPLCRAVIHDVIRTYKS